MAAVCFQRSESLLAFISNMKGLLQPADLRPLLTCSMATSRPTMQGYMVGSRSPVETDEQWVVWFVFF